MWYKGTPLIGYDATSQEQSFGSDRFCHYLTSVSTQSVASWLRQVTLSVDL